MLFRTSSVLILETGTGREILLRQSGPDIRTNFERPGPRSKLVNTARGSYRMSSFLIFGRFFTDYEYYVAHQILPPIERLCDPIEGTDRARLAECLGMCLLLTCHLDFLLTCVMQGLDPGRYRSTTVTEFEERRFSALESQLPDSERYKDAAPFVIRCRACECKVGFAPVSNRAVRSHSLRSITVLGSSRRILGVVSQSERSHVPQVR